MNANQTAKKIVTDLSKECEYWMTAFRHATKQRCYSMNNHQLETFRDIVSISVVESELDKIKQDIIIRVIDDKLRGIDGALVETSEFKDGENK